MDAIIESIKNKMEELSDMKKVYNYFIKLYDKNDMDLIFYHLYGADYNSTKMELKEKRTFQEEFRDEIIKRDINCILSDAPPDMCEAAHIIPYCDSNNDTQYDVDNGLLLEAGIHKLFDKHMWSINQNSVVVVSNKLLNDKKYCINKHFINGYHGKKLHLSKTQLKNLKPHFKQFNDVNK